MLDKTQKPARRWPRRVALVIVSALAAVQVWGWVTSSPEVGHFRTTADLDAYVAAYRKALATMPAPTRTIDVETSFGSARAYEWSGPESAGPPVVLLPGRGSGVPMWSENLPEILKHRTVFALDAIGDAGLSTQAAPIADATDQAAWIDDALRGLKIDRAHIVGHSFGAAQAAALALHHPERVATLTLLEPAFVLGWPPFSVLAWSIPASLPFLPQAWRDVAVAKIAGEEATSLASDDPVTRMITLGGSTYSAALPTPKPLSDDELVALSMPVYIALAAESPITGGTESLAQAERIGDVTVKVWPNTSHSLPMQVAAALTDELAPFWTRGDL